MKMPYFFCKIINNPIQPMGFIVYCLLEKKGINRFTKVYHPVFEISSFSGIFLSIFPPSNHLILLFESSI
jgi:hypothetical protein